MRILAICILLLVVIGFLVMPCFGHECLPEQSFFHLLKESRSTSADLLTPQFVKRTLEVPWIVQPCRSGCSNIMIYPSTTLSSGCHLYLTFDTHASKEVLLRMEVFYTDHSLDKVWNLAHTALQALTPIVPSTPIEALPSTPPKSASNDTINFSYHWHPPEYVNHKVKVGGGVMGEISYSAESTRWIMNLHVVYEGK